MGEDAAAYIRMAVTIFMLAALVSSALSIVVLVMFNFYGLKAEFSNIVTHSVISVGTMLPYEDYVSAPIAYKYIQDHPDIAVELPSGVSNVEQLIGKYAQRQVLFMDCDDGNHRFDLKLK